MNLPTTTLKSGARIMTRPVLFEELPEEFRQNYPPCQPATYFNFYECCDIAAKFNGRLPTEDEWLEVFDSKPYLGSILEWTSTVVGYSWVLRGGGAWLDAWGCRSAFRTAIEPGFRNRGLGFRVVFDK